MKRRSLLSGISESGCEMIRETLSMFTMFSVATTLLVTSLASMAIASGGAVKAFNKINSVRGGFTGALNTNDWFGSAIAEIGDLDNDGVRELAVAAAHDDNGDPNPDEDRGAVWILFMNANGTVKTSPAPQKLISPVAQLGYRFGSALAWLGDLDATHKNALAIGALANPLSQSPPSGEIYIAFLKYLNGVVTVDTLQGTPAPNGLYNFGQSMVSIGDLDQDGVPDLAVGAAANPAPLTHRGAVAILFLRTDGTVRSYKIIGNDSVADSPIPLQAFEEFGGSVAWLGDLDASHRRVLIVGAGQNNDLSRPAKFYELFLTTDGTLVSYSVITNGSDGLPPGTFDAGTSLGSSATAVGDMDLDGVTDFAAGMSNGAYGHQGAAMVLFMNGDGTVKDVQKIIANADGNLGGADGCFPCVLSPYDYFGQGLALVSDRNGDGYPDLAVGALVDNTDLSTGAVYQLFLDRGPVLHPATCQQTCGDQLVAGAETCDDGNTVSGDGCSSTCAVEPGYSCSGCPQGPSHCAIVCGDGRVGSTEGCDDGNTANGDGCSSSCQVEPGYVCVGEPSVCTIYTPTASPTSTVTPTPTPTLTPTPTPCGPDGSACDDGLFCNGTDTCSGGACSVHSGNPCTMQCNATCQEAIDSCFNPAGTPCDDGDSCTPNDVCDGAGGCHGQIFTPDFAVLAVNNVANIGQGSRASETQATTVGGSICAREIKMKLFSKALADIVALRATPAAPPATPAAIIFQKANRVDGRCVTGGGWVKHPENAILAFPPCDTSGTSPKLTECSQAACRAGTDRSAFQSLVADLDIGAVKIPRAGKRIPETGTLGSGRVVIKASEIRLLNFSTLTLVGGPSTTQVIVVVSGGMRLGRPATIALEGLQPEQVLFVVHGSVRMHSKANVSGTIYSADTLRVGFSSEVKGALISDKQVTLGNFVHVEHRPFAGW